MRISQTFNINIHEVRKGEKWEEKKYEKQQRQRQQECEENEIVLLKYFQKLLAMNVDLVFIVQWCSEKFVVCVEKLLFENVGS